MTIPTSTLCTRAILATAVLSLGADCCVAASRPAANGSQRFPSGFRITPILGPEAGVSRRDPSDVIRVGSLYYVWYTRVLRNNPGFPSGYPGSIWYAVSSDGLKWTEKGPCLEPAKAKHWDDHGVFTPNILVFKGKYYLYYTAVASPFNNRITKTAIGVAEADSPDGPWHRFAGNPVLVPSRAVDQFDCFRVDDACLIVRDHKVWLFYKGRQLGHSPGQTKMGIAFATSPTGPFVRCRNNPVVNSGHEVMVWPLGKGIASMTLAAGPQRNTWQYAEDGIHFRSAGKIRRPLSAPGSFRLDAFADTHEGHRLLWGVEQIALRGSRGLSLARWDAVYGSPAAGSARRKVKPPGKGHRPARNR